MCLSKNEIIETTICNQGISGEGVARKGTFPIFIDGALPGERVTARITQVKKTHAFAEVIEILQESAHREHNVCQHYNECGGCSTAHQIYDSQLKFKKQRVIDCLSRIAQIDASMVEDTLGMEEPYRYRNKVSMMFGKNESGDVILGFYKKRLTI